ncbi:excitatory amino acid transporter 3 [Nematostella vectensis]|uniref:excitatory amino acid transporter 3 n=1 Tax=Nematostella vectensis TaxID=45351 RepID=UPI00138FF86F|nr:excitatory amino acid transporter 3 [Nematostella vectensis]
MTKGFYGGNRCGRCCGGFWKRCKQDLLLILIVIGVFVGFVIGFLANGPVNRIQSPEEKTTTIILIGLLGELFMAMLKMLILPLIMASLICALGVLDSSATGKIGRRTVLYYLCTTLIAVLLGIAMVSIIQPGKGDKPKGERIEQSAGPRRNLDSFLDLIRSLFPNNIVEATFMQKTTKYKSGPGKYTYYNVTVDMSKNKTYTTPIFSNGTHNITTLRNTIYGPSETIPDGYSRTWGLNVLGIVMFSIVFGIVLGRMGERGAPLKSFFETLNEVIMQMITIVMWLSPIGICSLIAKNLVQMGDIPSAFKALGMFIGTSLAALLIHGLVILPLVYFICTRRNPFKYMFNLVDALVTAFGTDSSSATLPTTIRCCEEENHVDKRIVRFVLPLGATVNMDGTALYEGVCCLWIAQMNGIELGPGEIVTTVLTATAAAIGAAGIPSAGLVTMLIVLQAVGLPTDDIALIWSVDWFIDRFRTMVNITGDAYGAGVVEHLSRDDLMLMDHVAQENGQTLELAERYTPHGTDSAHAV